MLDDKTILVTGATGSFGHAFIRTVLRDHAPRKVCIFSRDELKQHQMRQAGFTDPRLRWFIGDVRDQDRLRRAMKGVDIVVHAAALKQVLACEYNPIEAIKTNVDGAINVIEAALDAGVERVLALSTDKACNPVNLYGATKLAAEKVFVQSNAYAGSGGTRFSVVRYGNVVGSRGSVIPVFQRQRETGTITITDSRMTRFWLTLEQGVRVVIDSIERMTGGEIFVPKLPSMSILDLATAVAPDCEVQFIGIRPGEKLHEMLLSEEEARHTVDADDFYVVMPLHPWSDLEQWKDKPRMPDGFRYTSDANDQWLSVDQLKDMIG